MDQVAELRALLADAELAIAASYQGMRVADQMELRRRLAGAPAQLRVVKNTLLRRAAAELGREDYASLAEGPTALVVTKADPVATARLLAQYRREHANTPFRVQRAVLGATLVDGAYVEDLATVPPREELIARIAGGLVSKIAELAGLLQATTREFAGLIDARASQLEAQQG
jgi:large subunit ribosomal protein L10